MHFFSLFTFATVALSAVSALPVSNPNGIMARDDMYPVSSREIEVLETRGKGSQHKDNKKHVPPPPPSITFLKEAVPNSHAAHNHMDRLDLHGDSRKQVEDYHRKVVEEHMKTIGAHKAVIVNLAHAKGSRDPYIHVSATFTDKNGDPIYAPRRGNPRLRDETHHIYTNKEDPSNGYHVLPHAYKNAVDKQNKIVGQPTGKGSI